MAKNSKARKAARLRAAKQRELERTELRQQVTSENLRKRAVANEFVDKLYSLNHGAIIEDSEKFKEQLNLP